MSSSSRTASPVAEEEEEEEDRSSGGNFIDVDLARLCVCVPAKFDKCVFFFVSLAVNVVIVVATAAPFGATNLDHLG